MNLKKITALFLSWQILIFLITWFSPVFLPLRTDYLGVETLTYLSAPLIYSRANFDGNHYLKIAEWGYGYAQQAFFPLYPFLIRQINGLFKSYVYSGLFISYISFFLALIILTKLLKLDYSHSIADWTVYLLMLFPVSFFFTAVYTEGIFFLLVVSAFYAARTRHWWAAGLLGALAAYSRIIGIALFPSLLFEIWSQKPRKLVNTIPLLVIPLGLGLYMYTLWQSTGDPLAFVHVQKLFNQGRSDNFILIYQVFWRYIKMVFTVNRTDPLYLTILLEFGTAIVFSVTSIVSLLRQRYSYAFYNFVCIFIPPLTGSFTSLPRYALVAFPSFIILAQFMLGLPRFWRYFCMSVLLFLSSLYLTLFVRGFWVA